MPSTAISLTGAGCYTTVALLDEWVKKAEEDYRGAVDLNRRCKEPTPFLVCYLCQQCGEKYLKAYLVSRGDTPPLIHSLVQLLNVAGVHDSSLYAFHPQAQLLTQYSVLYRYPGKDASIADAAMALETPRKLRKVIRRKLNL